MGTCFVCDDRDAYNISTTVVKNTNDSYEQPRKYSTWYNNGIKTDRIKNML